MTRSVLLALAVAAIASLSACNTMKGAGKDVSSAGHSITNEAQKTQNQM